MNKIITFTLILVIFGFSQQNPWPIIKESTNMLPADAGFFLDENTGWIYGNNGSIIKTTDGGLTWQVQQDSSTSLEDINDIYFYDSSNGWACGDAGTILHTTDGGITWNYISGLPTSEDLNGINFISTNIGYTCGTGGAILRSENSGNSWILQNSNTGSELNDISFFDANNGFAVFGANSSNVLWTNSGGFLWTMSSFTKPPGQTNVRMEDCKAVRGTNHAWMIGYHGNIFHSTNKGQNWTLSKSIFGTNFGYARAVDFVDANVGVAGSDNGTVFRTNDSGASWDSVLIGTGERILEICAIDANTIVAIGADNQIRKSIDGGNTWTPIINWPKGDFRGIGVADSLKIFMCTFGGDISNSFDGGSNFTFPGNENLPTKEGAIENIKFFNSNIGFYGGQSGQIAKTIDGGTTWYSTNVSGELKTVRNFAFFDQNTMWACGSSAKIYKSTDGGENWSEVAEAGSSSLYALHFFDDQIGLTAGDGGKIFRTTDGGLTWSVVDSVGDDRLHNFGFIDLNTGFVVGYNGILGKTTNGGNSWILVDSLGYHPEGTAELWDIDFVNMTEGWIGVGDGVGGNGGFYHTTDAGSTWQFISSANDKTIRGIKFLSPTLGWACGANGTILKYDATTGINNGLSKNGLNSFQLYSNYPNPFNPTTNIKYYINIAGNADLAIYNVNGQKIKTIIREYQRPGSYNFTWDGTNQTGKQVNSGTYFYRLKLDNQIHAKQMILLR
jgi:photosystem II stability/assembly factor-like uncharacterized protein